LRKQEGPELTPKRHFDRKKVERKGLEEEGVWIYYHGGYKGIAGRRSDRKKPSKIIIGRCGQPPGNRHMQGNAVPQKLKTKGI